MILLDNRVTESVSTRRMRVVKYRGSTHGSNEYPFLIDNKGFSILPVTSLELDHVASDERVSTGVRALDDMFGGEGYYRGSTVLISGTAGTGKTSLAAHFVNAACARGERCVIFSFEESAQQVARNMRSIGINLSRWVDRGLLRFAATRPTTLGIEMHLVRMHALIDEFKPDIVVVDPVTGLTNASTHAETRSMLLRLVDFLKGVRITVLMTALAADVGFLEHTSVNVSSLVDVWLLLRDIETGGERNRGLYVIKARGLAHSNQIREFLLTSKGVELRDVYLGRDGVLTGSARVAQEAREASEALAARQGSERQRLLHARRRKVIEARIAALQVELDTEEQALSQDIEQLELKQQKVLEDRARMAKSRSIHTGTADDGRARIQERRK